MKKKYEKEIKALHDLFIEAKMYSLKGKDSKFFYEYFDEVEYLFVLIQEEKDIHLFSEYLEEICLKFDLSRIWKNFNL